MWHSRFPTLPFSLPFSLDSPSLLRILPRPTALTLPPPLSLSLTGDHNNAREEQVTRGREARGRGR